MPYGGDLYHTEHVVDLNKVSIRYGERTILKDLDWTVMWREMGFEWRERFRKVYVAESGLCR